MSNSYVLTGARIGQWKLANIGKIVQKVPKDAQEPRRFGR